MSDNASRRESRRGKQEPADPPEMIFEIRRADGSEGQQLAKEQAAAIREVIRWLARRQSGTGQDRAA
jgi:hypothetical protein